MSLFWTIILLLQKINMGYCKKRTYFCWLFISGGDGEHYNVISAKFTLFSFVGLDVRGQGIHSDLFPRGSCVQEDLALLLARGRGSHHQPQHAENRGGLDG